MKGASGGFPPSLPTPLLVAIHPLPLPLIANGFAMAAAAPSEVGLLPTCAMAPKAAPTGSVGDGEGMEEEDAKGGGAGSITCLGS